MTKHHSSANWEGNLAKGKGKYRLNTSGYEGTVKFSSRFEDDRSTSSPEELIGAALSSCYSMALANDLDKAGHIPEKIETSAEVTLEKTPQGFTITSILLKTRGRVKDIDAEKFRQVAEKTKENCPVSRALRAVPNISVEAELV